MQSSRSLNQASCKVYIILKFSYAISIASDVIVFLNVYIVPVADPDQAFGGEAIGRRQKCLHLLKYQRLSATKEVIFCTSESGYFCWSNYAIFQGIATLWKRFISLIQKTFERGPKQWVSFFTSYTDLLYLQNVFKRYKSMLRASVCHCFGYP